MNRWVKARGNQLYFSTFTIYNTMEKKKKRGVVGEIVEGGEKTSHRISDLLSWLVLILQYSFRISNTS